MEKVDISELKSDELTKLLEKMTLDIEKIAAITRAKTGFNGGCGGGCC